MDDKQQCQSCGMPLGVGFYGTNADDTASEEFCKSCWEKGQFREPNLTLQEMIGRSIANRVDGLQMTREEAQQLATSLIPTLKRWQQ